MNEFPATTKNIESPICNLLYESFWPEILSYLTILDTIKLCLVSKHYINILKIIGIIMLKKLI